MKKSTIKNNIIASDDFLSSANLGTIISSIAEQVRRNRLELNLTQKALATRAGVSFASLRRFESTGEISLKSLVKIAIALDAVEEFTTLFTRKQYQSIDELVTKEVQQKKRGRKNE